MTHLVHLQLWPPLSELEGQLNPQHPLVKLAASIDWSSFETAFGRGISPAGGRPALPTRLMVGLHYQSGLYDESDESVVSKWGENPNLAAFLWGIAVPA